jgi:Integrase core domain
MRNYHVSRRFEIVAVDVVEISPTAVDGPKKALVICDQFTRFVVVAPIGDESAVTVARELLQHWILLFGPPERLLSDNGANFCGEIIRHLCAATGIKKVFTTPWHPQTDGTVERFNRTLCPVLAKVALREEDWSQHVPMAAFRYNSPYHSTTGMTPYRGMFGVDYFDFDAGTGLAFRLEDETQAKDLRLGWQRCMQIYCPLDGSAEIGRHGTMMRRSRKLCIRLAIRLWCSIRQV